jgi:hypothetical protein
VRVRHLYTAGVVIGTVVVLGFIVATAHAQTSSGSALKTVQIRTVFSGITGPDFIVDQPTSVILSGILPLIGEAELLGSLICAGPGCTALLTRRPIDSMCGSLSTTDWCLRLHDGRAWTLPDLTEQAYLSGSVEGFSEYFGQSILRPAVLRPPLWSLNLAFGVVTLKTLIVTPFQDGAAILYKPSRISIQIDGFIGF